VPIDPYRRPAIRHEALDLVVGHRPFGRPAERDPVVVEQHDQPAQAEMAGERRRLVADPFHQVAVAGQHAGAVVDDLVAVAGVEQALGKRHADGGGETLPERASRGLDAESVAVLGVPRRARAELAEAPQLVERHVRVVGQVEQRVEQPRAVPSGEHEAVAIGPVGGPGIERKMPREQHGRDVRLAHRQIRMARVGPLDRVHRERRDRIRHFLVRGQAWPSPKVPRPIAHPLRPAGPTTDALHGERQPRRPITR
jgi:hypothetical protein